MFKKFNCKSIVLSGFLVVFGFASNVSATPINTSATVLTSITVTEDTPLNFGSFTVGVVGGVLAFDAGGTISPAPDITHLGGEVGGVASLDTSGTGATTVTVTVTGTTLTSGANTMTLVGNCLGNGGVLGADNGSCTYASQQIVNDLVQIGGKLTVGASQPAGTYTGTLEVVAGF